MALKVLIADDNTSDRMILRAIVRHLGHEVVEAADGEQAVAMFEAHHPDIILMDVFMPNMDGQQAAWIIKQRVGDDLVPIIFLASLHAADELADCLDAGGDDFLSKPYNRVILQAKIQAFGRMRALHAQVAQQRAHLVREQAVAKSVFDSIVHHGAMHLPNVRYLISPMSIFNGDVMLVARQPSGGLSILLGDFTGHGLPAAIGAMPVSEIFYGMIHKGFALREITLEINRKLKTILPTGLFCCANLVDLNFRNRTIEVWTGGLPDNVLFNRRTGQVQILQSRHLPLGVLSPERFRYDPYFFSMDSDDVLYLWSDGIVETGDAQGQMYGETNLLRHFADTATAQRQRIFDAIVADVQNFASDGERHDDHTLLEVGMLSSADLADEEASIAASAHTEGARDWSFSFALRNQSLAHFDPLPLLVHMLMEVPGLRERFSQIYTLLAELYSNALDHGILRLDSSMKASPQGFAAYYQERSQKMAALQEACIEVKLEHRPQGRGGILHLEIEDSGPGFDHQKASFVARQEGYSGRGLPLIKSLCSDLHYLDRGNRVRAVYHWE